MNAWLLQAAGLVRTGCDGSKVLFRSVSKLAAIIQREQFGPGTDTGATAPPPGPGVGL